MEEKSFSADALHLSHLIASHGYLFQIDDHVLTVKNDGTFYRFQTPYFWPSNCWEPENMDYGWLFFLLLYPDSTGVNLYHMVLFIFVLLSSMT